MRTLARLVLVLAAVTLATVTPQTALADGSFRTVLVIDASSSMRRTDPKNLRKVAAELFVDMARDGDQIAVTGFDEKFRQSTGGFITIDGMASRDKIKQSIRAIGNDGKWTDFTAGLGEARRLLEAIETRPGDQELVVFLTDGKCEPDPAGPMAQQAGKSSGDREKLCQETVLGDIAGSLRGARVYAIGLSRKAPRAFLEEFGRRTGGLGAVTLDPKTLPELFAGVYARLLGSRLKAGDVKTEAELVVYDGAEVLDLVLVGRTDNTEVLVDPSGVEIPIDNRDPTRVYFVGAKEYRFFKLHDPKPGAWKVKRSGRGKARFATLQHFNLELGLVALPRALELGQGTTVKARLASPSGAMPPAEFLDRHRMTAVVIHGDKQVRMNLKRGQDNLFSAAYKPKKLGDYEFKLILEPGNDGVLSRATDSLATLSIIPPVHLKAGPIDLGSIKQGREVTGTLSLAGSEVGVALELGLALDHEFLQMDRSAITLPAQADDGEKPARAFELAFAVSKNAPAGKQELSLAITPSAPGGFADRAVTVPVTIDIIPLTFWELYGRYVMYGSGGLLFLIILLGIITPAKFKKRAILYYMDNRDPELARRSSYPIGVKAKRGFYKAARLSIGPSGPVKRAGVIELRASSGGAIVATPKSSSAVVFKVPIPDTEDDFDDFSDDDDDDKPRVSLKNGGFRVAAGVGYEVQGSGLIFWYK